MTPEAKRPHASDRERAGYPGSQRASHQEGGAAESGQREHEFKFSPGPLFQLPDLSTVDGLHPDAPDMIRLQATYFDTDDFRLSRAGASLRYRNAEGWTVKLPVARDAEALTRHELHLDGEPGEPPQAAVDLVLALIRRAPLAPVARLNTVRNRVVLRDEDGATIGEVVDDEVSLLDGIRLAARFRELEVELEDSASPTLVAALVARLRAAGAGHPDPVPKIVRALGPRAAEPPDLVPPRPLDIASTPAEVVQAAIATAALRLIGNDPGVRLGTDPEAVHQARVATRRLRSDLRTFGSVLDEAWSEPIRAQLQWLGALLGAVRDTEVLLDRLEARLAELPPSDTDDGKQLLDTLSERREQYRVELLREMRSERYFALLDTLVDAARAPKFAEHLDEDDDERDLSDFVRRPWRNLRDAVQALGPAPDDHELHRVRIHAKRCRYAAEAVAPALGKDARRFARAMESVQDVLGEHQDAVVTGQWLRTHATGPTAFVAGELVAIERDAARVAAREQWPEVWARARRKQLRQWM
ncbi:MAG: CYTH and CHAD domain-containing protein [Acidimicrobiia bacterium]